MTSFRSLEVFGDGPAVIAEREYSYAEMLEAADAIGAAVGERTVVFCLCSNTSESVFGYVGFLRAGIVPVLLDATIQPDQLNRLMELYKPNFIWANRSREELMDEMESVYDYGTFSLFRSPYTVPHQLHDELALLLSTSGSTGSPKMVRLSYGNLESNTESIAEYLEIQAEDRPVTTLPMNYAYGLSIINSHLIRGAAIVLTEASIISKAFWELFREQHVTTFGGVPFVYEMLDKLKFEQMELPYLKMLTQAGGKLNPVLSRKFAMLGAERGFQFVSMYGQTEATARMSYVPAEMSLEKAGSIGIAIPGGELFLEDELGRRIDTSHKSGELIYKGPNVSLGYAESHRDLARGDDNQGVLRTGDMAYVDEDGYYFVTGRKKRMIKLYGNRVQLDDLEGLLKDSGYECACTGTDDRLVIYTVRDDADAIKKWMKETVNLKGFTIRTIDELPRNAAGKILYSELPH